MPSATARAQAASRRASPKLLPQIHTHYPKTNEDEMVIMEQERSRFPDEDQVVVPDYMKEILAEITAQARQSSEINQRSGVSVRVSISNYETLLGNAVRRSITHGLVREACKRAGPTRRSSR